MKSRVASQLRFREPVLANRGDLLGSGPDYPTLGDDGWQTGAIWINTTGAAGTSLYVNEGSVTSCDFVAVDTTAGASAGAINFDDNVTGPLINIETTDPTNNSYTTPFIITGAYSSSADNAIVVSATNNRPVSFLFEDSGDVLTGDIRAGLFRLLLTVDQTGAVTLNALRAQIKANNLVDITSANAVVAPFTGYLELDGAGARTLNGHVACVRAALETGAGAHTVTSRLAGFESTLNSSGTFTAAKLFAYTANISGGTTTWQFGYKVEDSSCDTGIGIGACTTGIAMLGVITDGITINGATRYAIDIATSGVIRMGVQNTGVDLTSTYPFAIDVQCEANADIVAGLTGSTAGVYVRYAIETAQTSNTAHIGIFGKLRVKANMADGNNAGVMGWVEISGTTELAGIATTTTAAGNFSVIAPSTLNLSTGFLDGVCITCSVDDAATIGGTLTGLRLKTASGCYGWATGILVDLGTNVGAALELSSTGVSIILPQSTNDAASPNLKGLVVAASGAMTAATSGDPTFTGVQVTTPAIDCTADTITSVGVSVTTGQCTQTGGAATSTAFLATGGTLTSGSVYGLYVTGNFTSGVTISGSVTTAVTIAGTVATGVKITGATAYAIDILTSGVFKMGVQDAGVDLVTAYPYAMEVHCEANADIAAASSSAGIYTRFAIEAAQTTLLNHIAVFGKLRVKANMATGNHCGVYALVESSAGVIANGQTAAGIFALDFENTNVTTGNLNGIIIDSSVDTGGTMTATMSGLRIKKSGAHLAWTVGIAIESAATTTAITIGTCTTGITISACSTRSIDMVTTTATTALTDVSLASTYTGTTQWQSHVGAAFTVTYTPAGGTGSCWVEALGGKVIVDGIINAQTYYKGVGANLTFAAAADFAAASSIACAITASVNTDSGATISDGNICILHLNCASSNTALTGTAGICTFIFIDNDAGHAVGGMDSVMRLHSWDTPYLFDIPAAGYSQGIQDTTATAGDQCVGHLKVLFNGTAAYINLFSDNS